MKAVQFDNQGEVLTRFGGFLWSFIIVHRVAVIVEDEHQIGSINRKSSMCRCIE